MKEEIDRNKCFVNLNYACNNNCISCIMHERSAHKKSFEDIKKEIDEILQNSNHIEFNGGEPTLSPDLFDILDYTNKKKPNLEIGLLSNVRLFSDKDYVAKLTSLRLSNFKIITSLYGGNAELHDSITRTPKSFEQQIQGIRNIMSARIPVELRIIINKLNYRYLEDISNFISNNFKNTDFINIAFVNMKIDGFALKHKDMTTFKISDMIPYLQSALDTLINNDFNAKIYHIPHCILPKNLWKHSAGITAEKTQISFLDRCSECSERKECSGIWNSYIDIFGDREFKNIQYQDSKNLTKKTVIFLGYTCNNNCIFCCNSEKRHIGFRPTDELKSQIRYAKDSGSTYLELIGGEPTIHSDILEIVRYAKSLGFETIMFATNGRMFSNKGFAKAIISAGVNHIVFSIHGHNPELHDRLTQAPGSFNQMMRGLKNLEDIGFTDIGSNTTIIRQNYVFLEKIGRLIYDVGIRNSEFIFVDPTHGAPKLRFEEIVPSYEEVSPYVNKILEFGRKNKIKHWHVRYYPLCFIEQKNHDRVSELNEIQIFHTEHIAPDFRNQNVAESRQDISRQKIERCRACKFKDICEGYWREYVRQKYLQDNKILELEHNNEQRILKYFSDKKSYIRTINSRSRISSLAASPIAEIIEHGVSPDNSMHYALMEKKKGIRLDNLWDSLDLTEKKEILSSLAKNLAAFHRTNQCSAQEMSGEIWKKDILFSFNELQRKLKMVEEGANNFADLLKDYTKKSIALLKNDFLYSRLHNDLRFQNLLVDQSNGKYFISGILDFECSILGHNLFDLSRLRLSLMSDELLDYFIKEYSSEFGYQIDPAIVDFYSFYHLMDKISKRIKMRPEDRCADFLSNLPELIIRYIDGKMSFSELVQESEKNMRFLAEIR